MQPKAQSPKPKACSLSFLLNEPSVAFRVVKRKGELRYIASNRRGSVKAVTQFAPPTKPLPKLIFRLASLIDFRVPGLAEPILISKDFLAQVSDRLSIPVERIGIYVGEPNERRKLVLMDTTGESRWVLKMAVGSAALEAISNERKALGAAAGARCLELGASPQNLKTSTQSLEPRTLNLSAPAVREVDPVCGKSAILIERVSGKQLTPEEFEAAFFAAGASDWFLGASSLQKEELMLTIEDWMGQNPEPRTQSLAPLLAPCRATGALELRSPLGLVHGDFAPWNVLRIAAGGKGLVAGGRGSQLEPSAQRPVSSALCAIDWEFSRADTPLIFDIAYAAWCYSELLGRTVSLIDSNHWKKLVALGALWKELRRELGASG